MSQDLTDELYAGSLGAFVAARNALAKARRQAGDKDGAARIAALSKPTLPAWACNQLVRGERALVDRFFAALDRQRALQLSALHGGVDPSALRDAKESEKRALSQLMEHAAGVLEADGHGASKGNLDRVARTLRSAALKPEARALLERGSLADDELDAGFDALAAQLDPALLLAALQSPPANTKQPRPKVDAFFARAARGKRAADAAPTEDAAVEPEAPVKAPTPDPTPRRERAERDSAERDSAERDSAERLTRARARALEAKASLAEARAACADLDARLASLEQELETTRADARRAHRRLAQMEERVVSADKRVRILDS